jgi:UDP:flavonoid glycosyltransferase YjiC (YdhE family)
VTATLDHTKKILVCPLDWGLGHAARDVAIIQRLVDRHYEVILACDGQARELLQSEFPALEILEFRSLVRIRYSRFLPAWLKITLLSPLLFFEIVTEHIMLRMITKRIRPDIIISDNRYGLWIRGIPSILVTHQLNIRLPRLVRFLEYPVALVLRLLCSRFKRCWIPDFPGELNLSGDLSHRYRLPANAVFIGALSRFVPGSGEQRPEPGGGMTLSDSFLHPGLPPAKKLKLVILLSGPEPQRSILQKIILKQVLHIEESCVVLLGQPGKQKRTDLSSTLTTYNHLPAAELKRLLLAAEYVICSAGYTSIMDLALLGKKALIIPTPGQTEQEYLAATLPEKGLFLSCSQNELDIPAAMNKLASFSPSFGFPHEDLLGAELDRILGQAGTSLY